jgi:hypothetical protein
MRGACDLVQAGSGAVDSLQNGFPGPQAHGAPFVGRATLRHEYDRRKYGSGIEFCAVGLLLVQDIARKFYDGHLHPQTDAQVGDLPLPGKLCCQDHALHPSAAEAPRDQNPVRFLHGYPGGLRQSRPSFGPTSLEPQSERCQTREWGT